jgi:hypothetical protein
MYQLIMISSRQVASPDTSLEYSVATDTVILESKTAAPGRMSRRVDNGNLQFSALYGIAIIKISLRLRTGTGMKLIGQTENVRRIQQGKIRLV